jgi:iron complex transport system substrate-binding protein
MKRACGFHLDGAAAQAELAARQLSGIPVWAIDADRLVVRPGPRLVDGVEALASILHSTRSSPHPPTASAASPDHGSGVTLLRRAADLQVVMRRP